MWEDQSGCGKDVGESEWMWRGCGRVRVEVERMWEDQSGCGDVKESVTEAMRVGILLKAFLKTPPPKGRMYPKKIKLHTKLHASTQGEDISQKNQASHKASCLHPRRGCISKKSSFTHSFIPPPKGRMYPKKIKLHT